MSNAFRFSMVWLPTEFDPWQILSFRNNNNKYLHYFLMKDWCLESQTHVKRNLRPRGWLIHSVVTTSVLQFCFLTVYIVMMYLLCSLILNVYDFGTLQSWCNWIRPIVCSVSINLFLVYLFMIKNVIECFLRALDRLTTIEKRNNELLA